MSSVLGSGATMGAAAASADDRAALRRDLLRLQRESRWKALALIAPLFVFLLLVFVVPIAILLTRAVDNREVAAVLPQTALAMKGWQGNGSRPRRRSMRWSPTCAPARAKPWPRSPSGSTTTSRACAR